MRKLLTFDLGGVCFFTNLAEMNKRFTQDTGISFRPTNGGTYHFYYALDRGEITVDEYFEALKEVTGSKKSLHDLQEAYKKAYLETSTLNQTLLNKIGAFRTRHRVVCVSTTNRFHEQINGERGLFDYFDALYFSHDMGVLGIDFLRKILARERFSMENVLMIDNDAEQIANGRTLGIETILFQDNDQLVSELGKRGLYAS